MPSDSPHNILGNMNATVKIHNTFTFIMLQYLIKGIYPQKRFFQVTVAQSQIPDFFRRFAFNPYMPVQITRFCSRMKNKNLSIQTFKQIHFQDVGSFFQSKVKGGNCIRRNITTGCSSVGSHKNTFLFS